MTKSAGFTAVDVVILLALGLLVAIVVVPARRVRWIMDNEERVVDVLRDLERRLVAHQRAALRDTDHDGVGEYASLTEVLGDRAGSARRIGASDVWEIDGYRFVVMVPGPRKMPVLVGSPGESANSSEAAYLLIAWPAEPGETGMRAYLTSAHGVMVHQIDGYPYGDEPPAPEWALVRMDGETPRVGAVYEGGDWRTPARSLSR